jgi:hypothetical protein
VPPSSLVPSLCSVRVVAWHRFAFCDAPRHRRTSGGCQTPEAPNSFTVTHVKLMDHHLTTSGRLSLSLSLSLSLWSHSLTPSMLISPACTQLRYFGHHPPAQANTNHDLPGLSSLGAGRCGHGAARRRWRHSPPPDTEPRHHKTRRPRRRWMGVRCAMCRRDGQYNMP